MNRSHTLLLIVCLFVSACSSVPPAPADRFYRLQAVNLPSVVKVPFGTIAVQPFRADSLYAERPVIYAEETSLRQLRQYHYHLWLYPPAQMVQTNLVSSLGRVFDFSGDSAARNTLEGRVVSFERVLSGKSSKAVVALELQLRVDGKARIRKLYQAQQPAMDESLEAFVVAVEQALANIYVEFLDDISRSY